MGENSKMTERDLWKCQRILEKNISISAPLHYGIPFAISPVSLREQHQCHTTPNTEETPKEVFIAQDLLVKLKPGFNLRRTSHRGLVPDTPARKKWVQILTIAGLELSVENFIPWEFSFLPSKSSSWAPWQTEKQVKMGFINSPYL